ncbi:MAG: hypothetical protein RSE52_08545, partial [Erysipelotrichaceae bacterium]
MDKAYKYIKQYKVILISVSIILVLIIGATLLSSPKSDNVSKADTPQKEEMKKQNNTYKDKKENKNTDVKEDDTTTKMKLHKSLAKQKNQVKKQSQRKAN